jgi:hypothetical protein
MNSPRMVTMTTLALLLSSSARALADDPARIADGTSRPAPAARQGQGTPTARTSAAEPARLRPETWPTWLEAVGDTQATGRPTVIVVTSQRAPRSTTYAEGLRGDLSLAKLMRDGAIQVAELSAEDEAEQVSRLRISSFPTIIAYRRGTRGLEAAGRHQGIMPAPQLLGWLLGLGLVPAQQDEGPAVDLSSADHRGGPDPAPATIRDGSLKPASYDDAYATPQTRSAPTPYPQYQGPSCYAPPTKSAPPPTCPPPQQAPPYQVVTVPQAAPTQAIPVTIVPQQPVILQQAPQQAAPINLLTVAAPSQPVTMAAPTQAAPTQTYVMAAPTQAAPTQTYVMAAPTQAAPTQTYVMAAPTQMVMAAPAQMVMAAPTQFVAAAPGAGIGGAGLTLPGLNLQGLNLSLRPPGMVDRVIGRIGKKLHTRSYPRVAIDIDAIEAANDLNEKECVPAKRPKRHADEDEDECPPPRRRPQPPPYDGPAPSPQYNYPPTPSVQRP